MPVIFLPTSLPSGGEDRPSWNALFGGRPPVVSAGRGG
ncbi:hypothetical protein B005_1482 [Nocardiopsis alba ATCC BAA-2165]|uniref:Uncharacterized protein n=1 Tax=Nocardiopsis alba (strain ATCC BAA-2165 / BE74) TaxID=1205910 RepID=J7L5D1_NOCAA|nr:hypothetical protein B005_1482 [Nocardiopsis alba ATCC BAA-2165]